MNVEIKHYNELLKDELHDIVALRIAVFVVEQNCPYQELDGLDRDAYHLLVKSENQIIGTARILKKGVVYPQVAIGRVVTHPSYRKQGLGHVIMKNCMAFIKNELKENRIKLSAQSHLQSFYLQHGFSSTGKEYLEDGIPHTAMVFEVEDNQL